MKIKVSELTGPALDWAVAKCEGYKPRCSWMLEKQGFHAWQAYEQAWGNPIPAYSSDWSQGGPIIEQEKISLTIKHDGWWVGSYQYNYSDDPEHVQLAQTPLIAAMRCYVASKLGDEVDVPEELCQS